MTFEVKLWVIDQDNIVLPDVYVVARLLRDLGGGRFEVVELHSGETNNEGYVLWDVENMGRYKVTGVKDGYRDWDGYKIFSPRAGYINPTIKMFLLPEEEEEEEDEELEAEEDEEEEERVVIPLPKIDIPRPTSFLPDWTWKDYALVIGSFGAYVLFKDEFKRGNR